MNEQMSVSESEVVNQADQNNALSAPVVLDVNTRRVRMFWVAGILLVMLGMFVVGIGFLPERAAQKIPKSKTSEEFVKICQVLRDQILTMKTDFTISDSILVQQTQAYLDTGCPVIAPLSR